MRPSPYRYRHNITKTLRKQPISWTYLDACGRPDGDPYGNRTRVSAVKGGKSIKSISRPDVHRAFAPLHNNGLWRRGDKIKEPPGAKVNPGTAATGPGLDTKSGKASGAQAYTIGRGAVQ
jgi:hypothetical protein